MNTVLFQYHPIRADPYFGIVVLQFDHDNLPDYLIGDLFASGTLLTFLADQIEVLKDTKVHSQGEFVVCRAIILRFWVIDVMFMALISVRFKASHEWTLDEEARLTAMYLVLADAAADRGYSDRWT